MPGETSNGAIIAQTINSGNTQAQALYIKAKQRQQDGDLDGARMLYASVLSIDSNHVSALNNLAALLREAGQREVAVAMYRRAIQADPADGDLYYNLARTLLQMQRYYEALNAITKALELDEKAGWYWHAKGLIYHSMHQTKQALANYDKAVELQPKNPAFLWDRSLMLLTAGRYEEGWRDHDARIDLWHPEIKKIPLPLWNGEDLSGKSIWIYHDQGLGDTLMCLRYILTLPEDARIIVYVPGELAKLLRGQFGANVTVMLSGGDMPDVDYQLPMTSLPSRCWEKRRFEPHDRYIVHPDGPKFLAGARKFKGAIVWAGWGGNPKDHERSMKFTELLPLTELPDIDWFSFQTGPAAAQLGACGANPIVLDIGGILTDFSVTAQFLKQVDFVVTVDTSIAHLAGAMGIPTYLMVAVNNDWRWGMRADVTPWYQSVRIYRQKQPKQWEPVIAEVGAALLADFPSS